MQRVIIPKAVYDQPASLRTLSEKRPRVITVPNPEPIAIENGLPPVVQWILYFIGIPTALGALYMLGSIGGF